MNNFVILPFLPVVAGVVAFRLLIPARQRTKAEGAVVLACILGLLLWMP